jgi:beta-phosphoglucomutase-like phosphatase (HAD superfamily)
MTGHPALLFDFDGTLADTAQANHAAYAQALREVGVDIGREAFDRVALGRNWREFLPALLAGTGVQPQAVAARKAALYPGFAGRIRFNPQLVGLIEHRAPGVRLALVSSASRRNLHSALGARPQLQQAFDVVVSGDDVTAHKPDPEAYRLAAQRLGVSPAECIVFEDSEPGVGAGAAFGAQVLRVLPW